MKEKTLFLITILSSTLGFFISCAPQSEEKKSYDIPFYSDGYAANNPLKYIRMNDSSVYIMREALGYWGPGIIEIPARMDEVNDQSFKNLVLYDFDIGTENDMYVKRIYKKKDYQRSEVRNFIGYVFKKTPKTISSFEGLPVFKWKEYEKLVQDSYNSKGYALYNYFILDNRIGKMYWINPYDGYSRKETEILKWIGGIVADISVKENCYYERLTRYKYCECDSLRDRDYIIPSSEIHN